MSKNSRASPEVDVVLVTRRFFFRFRLAVMANLVDKIVEVAKKYIIKSYSSSHPTVCATDGWIRLR